MRLKKRQTKTSELPSVQLSPARKRKAQTRETLWPRLSPFTDGKLCSLGNPVGSDKVIV